MADRATALILDALGRALSTPEGLPLVANKASPGLFAATAAGRLAAQQARAAGYLKSLRSVSRGRAKQEICALSDDGLAFFLSQTGPREPLRQMLNAIEGRERQLDELLDGARACQATLATLKQQVERTLAEPPHVECNGVAKAKDAWHADVLTYLRHWPEEHPNEDCSLPELYRHVTQQNVGRVFQPVANGDGLKTRPTITPGQFHDGLRALHAEERVYLYPWTGPLYEIPEPALALLVGHAVAYYAAVREHGGSASRR